MKGKIVRLAKSVGLTLWIALTLVLISGFHQSESHVLEREYMMPCVMRVFDIPRNLTAYGFPFSWIAIVRGVKMFGCGSAVGTFAKASFHPLGFALNLGIYSLVCSPLGFLADRKLWRKSNG